MGLLKVAGKIGLQALSGIGAGDSYVVMGAITECTWGTKESRLILPLSHGVYINGKAQLNIMDFKPFYNILPFGKCKSLVNPAVQAAIAASNGSVRESVCMPVIVTPWVNGKADNKVAGHDALLCSSTNLCMFCGLITINDDGQR